MKTMLAALTLLLLATPAFAQYEMKDGRLVNTLAPRGQSYAQRNNLVPQTTRDANGNTVEYRRPGERYVNGKALRQDQYVALLAQQNAARQAAATRAEGIRSGKLDFVGRSPAEVRSLAAADRAAQGYNQPRGHAPVESGHGMSAVPNDVRTYQNGQPFGRSRIARSGVRPATLNGVGYYKR